MKTIFEHLAQVKAKPHHIRKRIAFAFAAGGSGLVALVWLIGSVSAGAFAIQGSTFAESTGRPAADVASTGASDRSTTGVAGAAAALPNTNAPARIEIVDGAASTSAKNTVEQTTIPF